ncbi:amidohydrolase [Egbenema bharatensis]|uniref:amidohydrolase n=1 Tax=Egbenema bharatensis TaxID=3463334 RepID=UPI003A85C8F7
MTQGQAAFTIQNALVPTEQGYQTVDVQITDGWIRAIASELPPVGQVINASGQLLLPGFVNAHTHSSELWQRGMISPLPLELWLTELYELAPLEPEQIYLSALGTAVETLLSGGTTIVDHLVLIPGKEEETIAAAVRAYREIGIRAFVAPLIQDLSLEAGLPMRGESIAHPPYGRSTAETLALVERAVNQFHCPEAGIYIMVAPTGIQLCSDALFEGSMALSDRYQLCRHAHLLETKAQYDLAREKYSCSAVEHLDRLGFLNAQTSLAHCVWLDDADITLLAKTRATVVHNPLSNLRLGSGIAPLLKYRRAGINITFGCDGSASNDSQDLLEVIKIGTMLHNTTDFDYRHWITPREAVQMASLGGAIGLNLAGQIGTLEVGKIADLVLYDPTQHGVSPQSDPIGLLIWGRPIQPVRYLWVEGRPIVTEGQVTTIDLPWLKEEIRQHNLWNSERSPIPLNRTESRYRRVMGLGELA